MQAKRAKTVAEYLASLPEDRRGAIKTVRALEIPHLVREDESFGEQTVH